VKNNWAVRATLDKILLSNISVHAVIGVHRYEQASAQPLLIDFAFSVDTDCAAKSDSIANTCDYAAVYTDIIAFVKNNPCRLLETLAQRLIDHLKNKFQLTGMRLVITKKPVDMPQISGVSVVVER